MLPKYKMKTTSETKHGEIRVDRSDSRWYDILSTSDKGGIIAFEIYYRQDHFPPREGPDKVFDLAKLSYVPSKVKEEYSNKYQDKTCWIPLLQHLESKKFWNQKMVDCVIPALKTVLRR